MKNIKEINIKIEGQEWEEALDKALLKQMLKQELMGSVQERHLKMYF